jgi:uncharacterized cupin superfamily protein
MFHLTWNHSQSMTQPYYWHYHPNSDETFLELEGVLIIELEDQTIELSPGQLFTVPTNVLHRTKPKGSRSVNLSFELAAMQTIKKEPESKTTKRSSQTQAIAPATNAANTIHHHYSGLQTPYPHRAAQ